jgi:hypothetical protein
MKTFNQFISKSINEIVIDKNKKLKKMTGPLIRLLTWADDSSTLSGGIFILRKSFYYRNGKTESDFEKDVVNNLKKEGYQVQVLDKGTIEKDFKGGAHIRNQSHWWVKVKVDTE